MDWDSVTIHKQVLLPPYLHIKFKTDFAFRTSNACQFHDKALHLELRCNFQFQFLISPSSYDSQRPSLQYWYAYMVSSLRYSEESWLLYTSAESRVV